MAGGGGRGTALLALAAAVAAVSWAAILVRLCEAPSLGIACYRMIFATALVAPWARPRGWRAAVGDEAGWILAAGLLLGLHFGFWISSLSWTTVASSVMLVSLQPVFTAVLGPRLLGEKAGGRGWLGIVLALAGTALLVHGDWGISRERLIGDALALLGAVTASGYLMIGRRLRHRVPFGPYLMCVYGAAAGLLLAAALAGGVSLAGYPRSTWGWLLLLALVPNVIGHSLLNWCVRRLDAIAVNTAVLGEPVLATAYAAWLLGEVPSVRFYPAALLILGGIVLVLLRPSPPAPATAGGEAEAAALL